MVLVKVENIVGNIQKSRIRQQPEQQQENGIIRIKIEFYIVRGNYVYHGFVSN